jgi:CBS domain-containing protein
MKIKDIMTTAPRTCTLDTTLATAGALMLDGDCGILPVLHEGKLAGVVTDRDLFIALATRDKPASEMTVREVLQAPVWTCEPEDDIHTALALMKQHRVRRLPVAGFGGTIAGIVSMNDLLLAVGARRAVRGEEVLDTMQAICAHHHPVPHPVAA